MTTFLDKVLIKYDYHFQTVLRFQRDIGAIAQTNNDYRMSLHLPPSPLLLLFTAPLSFNDWLLEIMYNYLGQ